MLQKQLQFGNFMELTYPRAGSKVSLLKASVSFKRNVMIHLSVIEHEHISTV